MNATEVRISGTTTLTKSTPSKSFRSGLTTNSAATIGGANIKSNKKNPYGSDMKSVNKKAPCADCEDLEGVILKAQVHCYLNRLGRPVNRRVKRDQIAA